MSLSPCSSPISLSSFDDLHEVSLFILEDELFAAPTPPPTSDEDSSESTSDLPSIDDALSTMFISPHQERPETSTSSIFSFVGEPETHPLPAHALTLPTFIVPENPGFYNSETASDITPVRKFERWMDFSRPEQGSFERELAIQLVQQPRLVRSAPAIPSLFKKLEKECGYCRSVGHSGSRTHTRQKCVQLHSLPPCKICGATGEMNHTETYCPDKPSVCLALSERFLRDSDDRRSRRSQHFQKYSSLIELIYPSSDLSF